MVKKILIGIGVLLVLVVLAVLVGPRFVDWNAYKGQVAQEVEKATGRTLAIDGNISLSLLPSPTLSVGGLRLANLPGSSAPDMVRVKSLDVNVALVPLLSGRIQVTRITLEEPVVLLERLSDGRGNWEFQPSTQAVAGGAASTTPAGGTQPSGMPRGALNISVDNFNIENGSVIYRAGATQQRLDGINATISAASIYGPYSAKGDATFGNLPAQFQLSTAIMETGTIPIQRSVAWAGYAAVVQFDGSAEQAAGTLQGRLSAKLADPALAAKAAGVTNLPPALAQPFSVSASVAGSGTEVDLSDLTLSLGDTSAAGKIAIKPGQPLSVDLALTFGRVDLDKLMPPAAPAGQTAASGEAAAPGAAGASALLAGFTLPGQIVATFDLSAEAIAYRKGVIDRPHLAGRLADGQLQIKDASAQLPGGSAIGLAGSLAPKDGAPYFSGALKASSDNLRDLMAWIGVAPPPVAAGRLSTLRFASRVAASPSQVELSDIDMKLDSSRIQGGVAVALPIGERTKPGFGIGLTVDQLDVDAYMPQGKAATGGASANAGAAAGAPAKAAGPLAGLAPLAQLEANFDLRAGTLQYNGQALKGLHLQGSLLNGKLTIADASAKDIGGGGQASLSGNIVDLAGDPHYDLQLALAAQDAAPVFRLAGLGKPAPGKYGALKFAGAVKGSSDAVNYDVSFSVGGLGVEGAAKGQASNLKAGVPKVDSTLNVTAKNAGPLAQLAGLPPDAAQQLGAFTLAGKATSGTDSVDYDLSLDLPGVGGKGAFKGKVTGLGGAPAAAQVASDLTLNVAKPAPLLALAGVSGATAGKLGALGLGGHLEGGLGKMKLALTLDILGAKVSVNGTVAAASTPIGFDVVLSVNAANGATVMAAFAPGAAVAGPLSVDGKLNGTAGKFSLRDFAFKGGGSDLEGNANFDLTGARPLFAANFGSNTLNAAAFGAAGGGQGGGGQAGGGQSSGGGNERWSHKPMDFSALDKADGTLEYKALHLLAGKMRIDDLGTRLTLNAGTLTIEKLDGKVYGGTFSVQGGKLVGRGTPSASGHVVAQNLEIAELAGTGTVKGPVSVTSDLAAAGASQADMISTLQGRGHLSGQVTILNKLQQAAGLALLGALGSQLQVLQGVTDSVGGIVNLFVGKQNTLAGDFVIDRGVLTTDNTTLSNPSAKAVSHGDVNLPPWKIAMQTDIYRAGETGKPAMSVSLIGPIDKPNVGVSGLAFKPSGVQNLLPSIIPGLKQPQTQTQPQTPTQQAPAQLPPTQQQPTQTQKPSTNDQFKSLLNNLLGQ